MSVMSLSFYEVLGSPQLRRFQRRLVGAGGNSLRVHGVCSLRMKLGASVLEQTFVVCADLAYDVIMGMDMIFIKSHYHGNVTQWGWITYQW